MSVERIWELMARKLAGEASDAELGELDQLLKANPNLHFPLQTVADLWQQHPETDKAELEDAFQKHLRRMEQQGIRFAANTTEAEEPATFRMADHPRQRKTWKIAAAAASLLLACSLIWYFTRSSTTELAQGKPAAQPEASSEIVTRNGSRTRITLPDGSIVWLNAGSKLNYDKQFGTKLREVTLTGEAYFDVKKNPDLPFVIHTNRIDVRVLGTQFNVKSYPGDKTTEAALVEGSIEVLLRNKQTGKILLKPNQKIVVGEDSTERLPSKTWVEKKQEPIVSIKSLTRDQKDSSTIETAWVQNKLVFVDEPLEEVAKRLERWYGVTITFQNHKPGWSSLTGTFTNESIEEALHALTITEPFTYKFTDAKTIVIRK